MSRTTRTILKRILHKCLSNGLRLKAFNLGDLAQKVMFLASVSHFGKKKRNAFLICRELFSRGMIPYFDMTNKEAAAQVCQGYRLPKPKECPEEIYKLMMACWDAEPNKRPNFDEILSTLTALLNQHKPLAPPKRASYVKEDTALYNNV